MDKVIQRGDPFSYLGKVMKSVTKTQEAHANRVKVNGHTRSKPSRGSAGGSTGAQAPDGQPNPAMVQPFSHKKLDETRPGAATMASRAKSGAKNAATTVAKSGSAEEGITHEAGESAAYEKMEDKTLKGLKGSKNKILTEGHNTSMKLGGGGRFKAVEKSAAASGAKNPAAVAAAAGMKKYGKAKMAKMAAAGRKRS
jgi:hypothetical protein